MKKYILLALLSIAISPAVSQAAFNDVTFTTDAIISVGGYTLNISGSSAVIETIVVNDSSFSVTLGSGSAFEVTSGSLNELTTDITTGVTKTCTSSLSKIVLASPATVTITPSATLCSGGSSSGGGGGGGGSSGSRSSRTTVTPVVPAVTPAALMCPTGFVCTPSTTLAPTTPSTPPLVTPGTFTRSLTVGSSGPDVKALQVYLNTHGYTIATTGPGSPGKETTLFGALTRNALIKFQKANNIVPAVGFFGPITRTYIK